MKILFVFYNIGSGISFHPGVQVLSALAKRDGHETKLLHFHEKELPDNPQIYLPIAEDFNPDLIAFTSTDFEYQKVNNIARELKKEFNNVPFLLGGKSAIEVATKDISSSPFDIFCIGEAEIPFMELLNKINSREDYTSIKSLWLKKDGNIIKNPLGENVIDLDSLPYPDYELFDTKNIIEGKGGWLSLQFSRGCTFNCTYCYVTADKHQMFDKTKGEDRYGMDRYLRNNSVEYSMEFMESLAKKYPNIKVFNLDDELPQSIEMHKGKGFSWWLDFCRQYKDRIYDKYNIQFCCNGRINLMTETVIMAMVSAGCRECRMGFECGSYRIRKEILDKPITNEKMREIYGLCHKYGLRTTSFTMIGIPTETEEEIWDTIRMTAELKPFLIRLSFCYPFENTRLWFYAREHNLIKEDRLYQQHGYFEESVFKLPVEEQKLMAYRHLFPWYVNTILLKDTRLLGMYKSKIEYYKNADFPNEETKHEIQKVDKQLSEACGNASHFCYFGNGYFHYKKGKEEEQNQEQTGLTETITPREVSVSYALEN